MHSALVPRWTTHVNKMDNVFEFNQRPWSVRLSVCWSPVFIVCLRGAASYDCRCCCASSLLKCQGLFNAHLDHWSPSRWQSISPPTWRWSFFYFFYFFESPSIWLWFGLSRIVFEAIVSVHNIIFFWDFFYIVFVWYLRNIFEHAIDYFMRRRRVCIIAWGISSSHHHHHQCHLYVDFSASISTWSNHFRLSFITRP